MSHTLKLLLTIINKRVEKKIDEHLDETQFGFVARKGTRDAILLFKMIVQRALAVNRDIYVAFIDYEKAFDRVKHEKLMSTMEKYGIDREDLQLIGNLYWKQKAKITIGKTTTEEVCPIEKGVRQGCPLSPRLFNLYTNGIMKHRAFENTGFRVNGKRINNITYADDKVLIAETPQQLQRMVSKLASESEKVDMRINAGKTKVMRISRKQPIRPLKIHIGETQLEEVSSYQYLGCTITNDGKDEVEIKRRIGMARNAFNNLERVIKDKKMSLELRKRIVMCYVWSVVRYASETWILSKAMQDRINSFEMWCYRRLHRIKWTEKVTNEEVLQRSGLEHRILLIKILEGKRKFLDAKMEKDDLFRMTAQGKIPGKTPRGRRRLTLLHLV